MKLMVVEDDPSLQMLLQMMLGRLQQFEIVAFEDGDEAWASLAGPQEPPRMALVDWVMPGVDGLELCRRIRASPRLKDMYVVMLTSKTSREHVLAGLEAGANDYIVKPFNPAELMARLSVARQVATLQMELEKRVKELEDALGRVKTLEGLLPICCYCKKIRDDETYWSEIEVYIQKRSDVEFSHGICPECYKKHIEPQFQK